MKLVVIADLAVRHDGQPHQSPEKMSAAIRREIKLRLLQFNEQGDA